jgi:hypothetical protein
MEKHMACAQSLNIEALVNTPNLGDRDFRLLLTIGVLKERGSVFKADIAERLGVCLATVQRGIKRLKQLGLLVVTRISSTVWEYVFHPEITHETVGVQPGAQSPSNNNNQYIILSSNTDINNTCVAEQSGAQSVMAPIKLHGPKGTLQDILSASEKREARLSPSSVFGRPKKSKTERNREKYESKSREEFTSVDMRFLFEDSWRWRGKVPYWTGKDYGLIKRLLTQYGPVEAAGYLEHVFSNWEDIARRYRIHGYPTVGVLSAYSQSLYPEYLNGLATTLEAEYRPEQGDQTIQDVWKSIDEEKAPDGYDMSIEDVWAEMDKESKDDTER